MMKSVGMQSPSDNLIQLYSGQIHRKQDRQVCLFVMQLHHGKCGMNEVRNRMLSIMDEPEEAQSNFLFIGP